jgi:signal transduction histidine kinase
MWLIIFSSLTAFLNVGLGIKAWRKQPENPANIAFAVFAIGAGMWTLFSSLTLSQGEILLSRIMFSAGILIATGLFVFVLNFPYPSPRLNVRHYLIILLAPLLFYILSYTPLMIQNVTVVDGHLTGNFGPAFFPYVVFTVFLIITTFAFLFRKYRASSGINRLQIKYLFLGSFLFLGPALLTNSILPGFFNIRDYNVLGPHFSIFMVGFTSYAIIRYQLMDIRIVLQLGFVYSLLFSVLAGLYLSLVLATGRLFQSSSDSMILISAGLTAIIGAFTVRPLDLFFRRITDPLFHKHEYSYAYCVHYLSEVLNNHIDLSTLAQEIALAVKKLFKNERTYFLLPNHEIYLACNQEIKKISYKISQNILSYVNAEKPRIIFCPYLENYVPASPSHLETPGLKELKKHCQELKIEIIVFIWKGAFFMGAIGLGKKKTGAAYTTTDLNFLKTLSVQASVALEKAQLYERLKEYSQNLESQVEKRTSELKAIHQNQEQMFLDISHSLQTPLTVAKNELSRLAGNPNTADALKRLQKSLDKMSKTVYKLLHLARIEKGLTHHPCSRVNLSRLMEDLAEYFSVVAEEKGIELTTEIEPGVNLNGNQDLLTEMVTNILSNSYKYAFKAGNGNDKKIAIRLSSSPHTVFIEITDNGRGIDPADLPFLFDRFKRGTQKNSLKNGGGLGLAICQKIVKMHEGRIEVKSRINRGSCFRVILPRKTN